VAKAHRLVYHSPLGLRVITKKKRIPAIWSKVQGWGFRLWFGVSHDSWFRAQCVGFETDSSIRTRGFGLRVSGVGFRIYKKTAVGEGALTLLLLYYSPA